jgi:septal ring factor EnvC (AmiA/AmiB activator)
MVRFNNINKIIYKTVGILLLFLILQGSTVDQHKKELKKIETEIARNKKMIKKAAKKENITLADIEQIENELFVSQKEKSKKVYQTLIFLLLIEMKIICLNTRY